MMSFTKTIHRSTEFFCHETGKTWNYRHEINLWWYWPLYVCILNLHVTLSKWKSYHWFLVTPDTISNENRWVIGTSSIHVQLAIVTCIVSMDAFITTMLLAREVSAWWFIVAAFIAMYCFILMVEIDYSYGLCCCGLCCHSSTALLRPAGAATCNGQHSCCAGVAAQTIPAQTTLLSIPIMNHATKPGSDV